MASRERKPPTGRSPARSKMYGHIWIIGMTSNNWWQRRRISTVSEATARRASVRNRSEDAKDRPATHRSSACDSGSFRTSLTKAEESRYHLSALMSSQFGQPVTQRFTRGRRRGSESSEPFRQVLGRNACFSFGDEPLQYILGRVHRREAGDRHASNSDLVGMALSDPPQPSTGASAQLVNPDRLHVLKISHPTALAPVVIKGFDTSTVRASSGNGLVCAGSRRTLPGW